MSALDDAHTWVEQGRSETDDRIRTWEECSTCGAVRYGVFAKRLDAYGEPAWGPVGEWRYSFPLARSEAIRAAVPTLAVLDMNGAGEGSPSESPVTPIGGRQ